MDAHAFTHCYLLYSIAMDLILNILTIIGLIAFGLFILWYLIKGKNFNERIQLSSISSRKGKIQRILLVIGIALAGVYIYLSKFSQTDSSAYAWLAALLPIVAGVLIGLYFRYKK